MEQPFSLPQHPEQEGKAEIRRQRVKYSLKDVGVTQRSQDACTASKDVANTNFLKQLVPQQIWDSVGGRGFWVRTARLASRRCFETLPPEDDPSQRKCTSPQSRPRSMMLCPHILSPASWTW